MKLHITTNRGGTPLQYSRRVDVIVPVYYYNDEKMTTTPPPNESAPTQYVMAKELDKAIEDRLKVPDNEEYEKVEKTNTRDLESCKKYKHSIFGSKSSFIELTAVQSKDTLIEIIATRKTYVHRKIPHNHTGFGSAASTEDEKAMKRTGHEYSSVLLEANDKT